MFINAIATLAYLQATKMPEGKQMLALYLVSQSFFPCPEDDSPLGLSCVPPSCLCNLQDRRIMLGKETSRNINKDKVDTTFHIISQGLIDRIITMMWRKLLYAHILKDG